MNNIYLLPNYMAQYDKSQSYCINKNIAKTFIQRSENQIPSFRLRILRILDSWSVNIFVCSVCLRIVYVETKKATYAEA